MSTGGVDIGTARGAIVFDAPLSSLDALSARLAKIETDIKRFSSVVPQSNDKIKASFDRLAASLDPTIAAEQKLGKARSTLDAALKSGLIPSQEKYNNLLDLAKEKYTQHQSAFGTLIESVTKLTSSLGPLGSKGNEVAEGIGAIASKGAGIGSLVSELGPLLPVVLSLASGLVAVGIAFAAFEFIKGAVEEGLQLQGVIERLNDSLKNTGSYSGLSSHEIIELAGSYALLTGRTKEEEISAALVLTRFKNLNEQAYPKALDLVNAYAKAQGTTADEAARKLGPALDGNSRSMRVLKDIGVDLTTGQQATLKAMADTGHIAEFQSTLFKILTEKVGLAAGAHETLGIQAGRVRYVMSELKEGIASELIPALEYLSRDIFGTIDDWKQASKSASDFGHTIGDFLRGQIYGVIVIIHDVQAAVAQVFIWMDQAVAKVALRLAEFFSSIHLDSMAGAMLAVVSRANFAIATTTAEMYKQKKASDAAIDSWLAHKQALEGDTNANKKHKSAQDDVASAQKKVNDLIGEGVKVIQAYTDKLSDLADKLIEQNKEETALYTALQNGLEAYYRELLVQERRKAVLAEVTQLTKEHRTEIEKLQETLKKANDEKRYADAAKLKGMIDESNKSFERQKKAVGDLAGENVDLKHSTDLLLESNKSNLDFTGKQVELWGQLTDALTGTSIASREASIQSDIQKRVLDSLKHTQDDLTDSITETVRREHDFADSMKDALDVAKELEKLSNEATLQTAVSHIDSNLPQYLQKAEEQYLQTIAAIGHGSITEGQRIIDATQKALELFGIHIGNISDTIKGNIQKIQDAQILKSISGASKTPFDIYKEERDNILRVMQQSTNDVSLTAAQKIQIERDGNAALLALDKSRYESILSDASGALDFLAQHFGNFFAQLKSLVDGLQQAQGFGKNVQGLVGQFTGGSGSSAAGAAGGIATVVAIFAIVYDFVDKMIKAHNLLKWGTAAQIEVVGGNLSSPSYFDQAGKKISDAIRKMLDDIANTIGGVLLDLPQVIIRARKDGKKFGAYVAGIWIGEFDSAQEAMEAGIADAITKANFAGVSKEIIQALQASIGDTLDQIQQNIATAKFVRTARLGDTGEHYLEIAEKYNQEILAARRLGLAEDDLIKARDRALAAEKNQTLGIDSTASDRLAALASLNKGIGEAADSTSASLQQLINDTLAQIAALENQAQHPGFTGGNGAGGGAGGSGSPGSGDPGGTVIIDGTNYNLKSGDPLPAEDEALYHLREVLAQYMTELEKIPKALTDQEINMGIFDTLYQYLQHSGKYAKQAAEWAKIKVQIEFEQIKAQLMLLGKWEEFQAMFNDAYNAALQAAGKTPGKGGKGSSKDSVQSFITDRRNQLSDAGLDDFHRQLAQLNRDYDEQLKNAGKDKKLRAELLALQQQETDALIKKNQQDVSKQFTDLVNPNNAFGDLKEKFDVVKNAINGAGFGAARTAKMLDRLSAAEDAAIQKLSDQTAASVLGDLANVIADSDTNAQQHLLHNELLRQQEIINFNLKMAELTAEYEMLLAQGKLAPQVAKALADAFSWIGANANVLPGGKDWIPDFEKVTKATDSASQNLNNASSNLKSAAESLLDYQRGLHTDSSLGLVNSRVALDNAKSDFDAYLQKALTGDSDAIAKFRDIAETYRKDLTEFTPSAGAQSQGISIIDDAINRIEGLPQVKAALSGDAQATINAINYSASGISASITDQTAKITATAQQTSDNTSNAVTNGSAQVTITLQDVKVSQQETTNAVVGLRGDLQIIGGKLVAWKTQGDSAHTEDRALWIQIRDALLALERRQRTPSRTGG